MRNALTVAVALGTVIFAAWWFDPLKVFWKKPIVEVVAENPEEIRKSPPVEPASEDWPWWRGPARNAIAAGEAPPSKWSKDENVLWQAAVPGRGHSSPIVVGNKVFVTSADETAETMSLYAFERHTGKQLWATEIHKGGFLGMHTKNSQASATPACDGERVFTAFAVQDGVWVTAVDLEGKIVWQEKAGPFVARHGYGSSPVVYRSLVIVSGDNFGPGYVTAFDRKSGKMVWRKARNTGDSYGTPIVAAVAGREQLLLSGQNSVHSYDPASGDVLWKVAGPADVTANTVAFDGERVFASGGYPQRAIQCLDGKDGKQAWDKREKVYVTSMLAHDGKLFVVEDGGRAYCYDAGTGAEVWHDNLHASFSASPVQAGDYIFVPSEDGKTIVIQTKPEYKVVAANKLGEADEGYFATPTICGGRIYLRSLQNLYCIGAK
ncbi:MAG: PQQ-binding-like beta-propeller repeat protein [Gemmataceae bacterium]